MTKIVNLRPGCVGIDLQPALTPMRREEDRFSGLRDDPNQSLYTRRRRKADRAFCTLFAVCVVAYLACEGMLFFCG